AERRQRRGGRRRRVVPRDHGRSELGSIGRDERAGAVRSAGEPVLWKPTAALGSSGVLPHGLFASARGAGGGAHAHAEAGSPDIISAALSVAESSGAGPASAPGGAGSPTRQPRWGAEAAPLAGHLRRRHSATHTCGQRSILKLLGCG